MSMIEWMGFYEFRIEKLKTIKLRIQFELFGNRFLSKRCHKLRHYSANNLLSKCNKNMQFSSFVSIFLYDSHLYIFNLIGIWKKKTKCMLLRVSLNIYTNSNNKKCEQFRCKLSFWEWEFVSWNVFVILLYWRK